MTPQKILIIAGMHRSGTSALARACNLAGADLGTDLMLPQDDNPTGFWEHREIVELHDNLLATLGSSWDDTRPLPREWWKGRLVAPFQEQLQELLPRVFSKSELPAVKDPRICRLLPLWTQALRAISWRPIFLLQTRNPIEVALSLQLRNGFIPQKSYLLWLRHTVEVERWTRGSTRILFTHQQLLRDRSDLIEKIWHRFTFSWPAEDSAIRKAIDDFVQPGLHHHEAKEESLQKDPRLVALVGQAYGGWIDLVGGEGAKGHGVFDTLNQTLEGVDYLFTGSLTEARRRTAQAEEICQTLEGELRELRNQRAADRAVLGELRRELDRLRDDLRSQSALRAAQSEEVGRLSSELAAKKRKLVDLELELAGPEEPKKPLKPWKTDLRH